MGIKVMAVREGQYGDNASEARLYVEGEVFVVSDESKLGSWMERLDGKKNPAVEKIEKARKEVQLNGYAPIDVSKVKALPTPTKGDKLKAAKTAKEMKKLAAKKAAEDAEDADTVNSIV